MALRPRKKQPLWRQSCEPAIAAIRARGDGATVAIADDGRDPAHHHPGGRGGEARALRLRPIAVADPFADANGQQGVGDGAYPGRSEVATRASRTETCQA